MYITDNQSVFKVYIGLIFFVGKLGLAWNSLDPYTHTDPCFILFLSFSLFENIVWVLTVIEYESGKASIAYFFNSYLNGELDRVFVKDA